MDNPKPQDDLVHSLELEDEDFYENEHQEKEPGIQFTCFRLSHEWYAVEISHLLEVMRVEQVAYLPSAPSYISGITSRRGNILSVTDLKKLFDLPMEVLTDHSRILIVASDRIETGLLADEVLRVVEIEQSRIEPPLSTLIPEKAQFIKGEFRFDDRLVTVLDIDAIITTTRARTENDASV